MTLASSFAAELPLEERTLAIPSTYVKLTNFAPITNDNVRELIISASNASCQLDLTPSG